MKIGMVIDYGNFASATSLNLIAKKLFEELGKIMNEKKNFTIAALKYEDVGIGDVNQHYDCICVPNMGGYRFPSDGILTSENVFIGLIGIDEVVLGDKVFRNKLDWERAKPLIEKETLKWKKGTKKLKAIHVATKSEKEQMIQYLQIPEEKIKIIPLGVDHKKFMPVEDKITSRKKLLGRFFMKDVPYFIHVSETNWARKNIFRIFEAFEKIKRSEGIKHKLIVIGKTDSKVYEKANEIEGVKILGFVSEEDLILFLQNSEAMIFPSLHEGFGFPSVEAIACGIPVIASNVFSSPEVLGKGAILVDPYNVDDIAEKIKKLALDQELRNEISRNALEQAKKYSWGKTAKQLIALIEENVEKGSEFNFEYSYELSAFRTLVTLTELVPQLSDMSRRELMEFNYDPIILWILEVGIKDDRIKDFIFPFKSWLEKKVN